MMQPTDIPTIEGQSPANNQGVKVNEITNDLVNDAVETVPVNPA